MTNQPKRRFPLEHRAQDCVNMTGIYKVSSVRKTVKANPPNDDRMLYGFNLIGVLGHPLVQFSYATEEEAEYFRATILDLVESAKVIDANPRR